MFQKIDASKLDYGNHSWPTLSYHQIVDGFGVTVLAHEAVGDYQGDYLYLLKDGERFGFLVVGYGSCSGCDALEAVLSCRSVGEDLFESVQELADSLHREVIWKDSAADMIAYLKERDGANSYFYGEAKEVIKEYVEILEKHAK